MFTHPDRIGQLAGEHHRQMLAQARQRQLRHQHGRPPASTRIIRRLAAAVASVGLATAQAPGAIWPARRTSRPDPDSRPRPLTASHTAHAGSSAQPQAAGADPTADVRKPVISKSLNARLCAVLSAEDLS